MPLEILSVRKSLSTSRGASRPSMGTPIGSSARWSSARFQSAPWTLPSASRATRGAAPGRQRKATEASLEAGVEAAAANCPGLRHQRKTELAHFGAPANGVADADEPLLGQPKLGVPQRNFDPGSDAKIRTVVAVIVHREASVRMPDRAMQARGCHALHREIATRVAADH